MSATARASGSPDRRSGPVRVPRGSTHRTGTLRTGSYRTGVVHGGSGRTATPRSRSVGHRATPTVGKPTVGKSTDSAAAKRTTGKNATAPSRSVPIRADLRLVPPPAPARRRLPFVLLVLGLLVGTTLSLLVLNTAIAVDSLKATSLRQQNHHRTEELQRLQQEVVNGSTVQKLAGDAAAAGLVPAGTAGYLVVAPDGTSTFRGDPAPATAPPAPSPSPGQSPAQNQTPAQDATGTTGTTGGN